MSFDKPRAAPVYYLDVSTERSQDQVISAGLSWLQNYQNGSGVLASERAADLVDLSKNQWTRSLGRVHTKNTGRDSAGSDQPLLALFPGRELLLKLTDGYLERVSAMCVLTWGRIDRFPQLWLDHVVATDLHSGRTRTLQPHNMLDPVVEAAFESLKDLHTGTLCTPNHSHDPNGVSTLLELKRRGHDLDADKLVLWAITEGFSNREVLKFVEHVWNVNKGHRYTAKSRGAWQPDYDSWVQASRPSVSQ